MSKSSLSTFRFKVEHSVELWHQECFRTITPRNKSRMLASHGRTPVSPSRTNVYDKCTVRVSLRKKWRTRAANCAIPPLRHSRHSSREHGGNGAVGYGL